MKTKLLQTRLSLIMLNHNLTFLDKITDFQIYLKKHFNEEYTLDEIETGLHQLEESYMMNEYKENEIIASLASLKLENEIDFDNL